MSKAIIRCLTDSTAVSLAGLERMCVDERLVAYAPLFLRESVIIPIRNADDHWLAMRKLAQGVYVTVVFFAVRGDILDPQSFKDAYSQYLDSERSRRLSVQLLAATIY
jgi:hypothetical protein